MASVIDLTLVLSDLIVAALNGLNWIPVVVFSLLIGVIQSQKTAYLIKALLATGLALIINALWPLAFGLTPVLPDPLAIETQIQTALMFVAAFLIIRFLCVIKNTISLTPKKKAEV
ncbi:hypothetical protein [Asticcacaulis sp. YBE204]|uniref:hypothetical protein n=1 Tax=Asticcacaulis sp. YBE204 TaxID=1282363 RepID=UPI0003C40D92|nr:hypothetical protein [Asticcacaulis sp. YBE204]ESQ80858.1 hypothetical protein AEYBE204_00630 [Asticcacaulis sp. YBE204]